MIDRAVAAANQGDHLTATALATAVLAADSGNAQAEDLLAAPGGVGEIRRLTLLFADLVDSTVLSTQLEPEPYRAVVGRFRERVHAIVERYQGHIGGIAGDGMLVVFGYPAAHEDDVFRALRVGLDIVAEVARISAQAKRRFGIGIAVRVGIHRGLVYLDTAADDVYGLTANLAARVSGLASPGTVVVSAAVESLVRNEFELESCPAAPVKGVEGLVSHYRVLGERATPVRPAHGVLVGRVHECDRIRAKWREARAGTLAEPGLFLRGEPGIGKSRLAAETADLVTRSGAVVLELAGSPHHADVGLYPVRTLLERRCGIRRNTGSAERLGLLRAELAEHGLDPATAVPALAPVLAIAPEHGYPPLAAEGHRLQGQIAAAVGRYLFACLRKGPGLLVVEDVQWLDQATLDVVGAMLGGADGRLLVVLTGRDGDSRVRSSRPVQRLDLAPLTDAEADELIGALDPTVDADARAEVCRRCDGVPLHIEQVVASLGAAGDDPRVPDALYGPLFARLGAGAGGVPVVEAAAVIGRDFDQSLLTAVVELDQEEVEGVIDQLAQARVLVRSGADGWRFRHELLREVAAELAPPSVRRGLHARVADALTDSVAGEPDWPLIATHYEHAARHADAATAYRRASAVARRRGALAESRTYLTYALTQLERCPPGPDRDRDEIAPRLERGYLIATAEGAQSPAALADFERCLQLAGTDLRDDDMFASLTAAGAYYLWRADLDRCEQIVTAARASSRHDRDWFRPAIDGSAGILAWLRGEFDAARTYFERATTGLPADFGQRIQQLWFIPHDPVALAHEHLAWDRLTHGDLTGARVRLDRAVERAGQLGHPQGAYNHLYAIDMDIWVSAEVGRYDRARALIDELTRISDRYGLDHLYWQLLAATERAMVEGRAELASSDPDRAVMRTHVEALTHMVEVWQALGASTYRPFYWCVLGRFLTAAGEPGQARSRLDAALQFAADTGVGFYSAELLRARAATHADRDVRAADLAVARELARRQGAWLFELRACLDDFDLRGDAARAPLVAAMDKLPRDSALPELAKAAAMLA